MEQILTDQNFAEVLNCGKPLIVDFFATWCGPCRVLAPIIEELANTYDGRIVVGKVDCDENPEICGQYGIRNIPTVLFFKDGQLVDKTVGAMPKGELVKRAEALL